MKDYPHVEEPTLDEMKEGFHLKGKWKKEFFKNDNPLVLELGCGMGEYSVGLADKCPDKNFLGVDIKGARIWQGATESLEKDIKNVGFLRIRIDWIESCFEEGEVDEIWITFPDPFPRKSQIKKRLTSPRFLKIYKNILKINNIIHLKTDDEKLYKYSLESVADFGGRIISKKQDSLLDTQSYFEAKHIKNNKTIYYFGCKI